MASKITSIDLTDSEGRDGQPKKWVVCSFDNGGRWYPKITEIGKIISGLGRAEDKKYPNGQGHRFLKRFFHLCWGLSRAEVDELYKEFDSETVSGRPAGSCHMCGGFGDSEYSMKYENGKVWCSNCYYADIGFREAL